MADPICWTSDDGIHNLTRRGAQAAEAGQGMRYEVQVAVGQPDDYNRVPLVALAAGDARSVIQFSPGLYPPGKVRWHTLARGAYVPDGDGRSTWVVRTLCGVTVYRSGPDRVSERGTWARKDHAQLLGPQCRRCAAIEASHPEE